MTALSSPSAPARVVQVGDEHLEALAGFYRQVWDPAATVERVRAARNRTAATNPVHPGEEAPTFVFLEGDRALGHVTTIPVAIWNGEREVPAHWLKGLMVLPEHRNGPVGFLVLREALQHLDVALAMVVRPEARKLFEALGFRDLGAPPNHVKPLRPGRVIRRLDPAALGLSASGWRALLLRAARVPPLAAALGALARGALTLGAAAWSGILRPPPVTPVAARALPRLWMAMRSGLRMAPARTAAYLLARYPADAGDDYLTASIRKDGMCAGVAFVRRPREDGDPRLRGIRVATLSDLVIAPADGRGMMRLIAAAERVARRAGADALLCTASDPRLQAALRRRLFVRIAGNVHCLVRSGRELRDAPVDLASWWVTRGDSSADEVF